MNDYRVGDWVEISYSHVQNFNETKRVQITSVSKTHIDGELKECVKPIPLSREILLNNGFLVQSGIAQGSFSKLYYSTNRAYCRIENYGAEWWYVTCVGEVGYPMGNDIGEAHCCEGVIHDVHELQHILAFCGYKDMSEHFVLEESV